MPRNINARVAFISTMGASPWGGSEELWSQAALRLAAKGLTIGVNVNWWPKIPARITQLEQKGCLIFRRRKDLNLSKRIVNRFLPSKFHYRVEDHEYDWLDVFRPDLVVVSQGCQADGIGWAQKCVDMNYKFVLIAQAVTDDWPKDDTAFKYQGLYNRASKCFFVSRANLEYARLQFVSSFSNAEIVRNPFNVSYDIKPDWPDVTPNFRLACVARLEPTSKGQDILFQVMGQDKWKNRQIEIALYGNGHNGRTLTALKEMLGLSMIKIAGQVEDISSVWASHHALILPSRYEGLPLAVVEAMLCGRPCIVTNVGGNSELIEDNVTGFIASAPTVGCLDEAMERAWERRLEWRQIGQVASERIRQLVPEDPVGVFADELMKL